MKTKRPQNLFLAQIKETWVEIQKTGTNLHKHFTLITTGAKHYAWQFKYVVPIAFLLVATIYFFPGIYLQGHITHSDMDFGFQSKYMFRIFPVWNFEWSTPNFFNSTRILFLFPIYVLAKIFNFSGSLWEKTIIFSLLWGSAVAMFLLLKKIFSEDQLLGRIKAPHWMMLVAAALAGIFYSFNPYVVIRVQHIYLLVGHMMMPIIFLFTIILTENFVRISRKKQTYESKHRFAQIFQKITHIRSQHFNKSVTGYSILLAILGLAFSWTYATGAVHYLFFSFFLIAGWVLFRLIRYAIQQRWREVWVILIRFTIAGVITLLLLSYYVFPYIGASMVGSVNPPNINSIDSVDMVSRNNLPHLILYLISYWWGLFDVHNMAMSFWIGGGVLLGIMALGILLKIHNKFVLFFTGWCFAMFMMSFGTKLHPEFFVWLVFESPISGPIGFIFRDGNKFVGLLSMGMAVLLGYGLAAIMELLLSLSRAIGKAKKKAWFLRFDYFSVLLLIFLGGAVYSGHKYFEPVHQLYFGHLYYPTPVPETYVKMKDYLNATNDRSTLQRTLMMPRYEMIVSSGFGYARSIWNAKMNLEEGIPSKATSTMDIWSLEQRTYHPQEGSTVFWHTLHDFWLDNLSHHNTLNTGRMLRVLGIDRVVFHNDIIDIEDHLNNALYSLKRQPLLNEDPAGKIGFFSVFDAKESVPWAKLYQQNLLSFSGFSVLDALYNYKGFNENRTALFFASQTAATSSIKDLHKGDIVETRKRLDLLLTQANLAHYLIPFNHTLYGNPFYRWAVIRTDTTDWSWQLRAMGVKNLKHEFDFGKGIAYTFVSRKIDIEPYESFEEKGAVYNFTNYLKEADSLFESDIPDVLNIQENYTHLYDDLPSVFGKNSRGDQQYWRVARTQKFPAKPNNGYHFEITLSGRDTHLVHAKVKFYDAAGEEVGVSYVSAPREVETFDFVKFKGLYVTPPNTETFAIEILSLQNPTKASVWQVHEFKVLDLERNMQPNQITIPYQAQTKEPHRVFVRSFHNIKGGRIKIARKEDSKFEKIIATKTRFHNEFQWHDLDTINLEKGQNINFTIENLEGLNAVNLVMVIPESEWKTYVAEWEKKKPELHQLVLLESDVDFDRLGHRQVDKTNPKFTNGRAIQLANGSLKSDFSIVKEALYQINLRTQTFSLKDKKALNVKLITPDGLEIYSVEKNLNDRHQRLDWLNLDPIFLPEGDYQILIKFNDASESLVKLSDFRAWEQGEFEFLPVESEFRPVNCSPDVIPEDESLNFAVSEGVMKAKITQSPSCSWISSVSKSVQVKPKQHYLLNFEVAAKDTNLLHFKALFYDRNNTWVDSKTLYFPNQSSFPGFSIEELIEVPDKAEKMQLQVLSRPNPKAEGRFEMKFFSLRKFADMPQLDLVAIYEKPEIKYETLPNPEVKHAGFNYEIILPKKQEDPHYTLQVGESFTLLWGLMKDGQVLAPRTANMLLNAFPVELKEQSSSVHYFFRARKGFYWGWIVSAGTFFICFGLLMFFRRK